MPFNCSPSFYLTVYLTHTGFRTFRLLSCLQVILPCFAFAILPSDRKYDGVNLLPYVSGEKKDRPHDMLYWKADHINVIRKGDYKLIMSTRDGWVELYNLKTDKGETKNLSKEMPEKVKELNLEFYNWRTTLPKKPMWPRIMDHKFNIRGKDYLFPA